MDRMIYIAMTGAKHILSQQATVSQNLANISTSGFRAQVDAFRAVPVIAPGLTTRAFVVDSTVGTDFRPGVIQTTGRDLDLAVNGKGWIAVQGADGKEAYTRDGSLAINTNGLLQTRTGLNVLSSGGTLSVPPDSDITDRQGWHGQRRADERHEEPSFRSRSPQTRQPAGRKSGAWRGWLISSQRWRHGRCRRERGLA